MENQTLNELNLRIQLLENQLKQFEEDRHKITKEQKKIEDTKQKARDYSRLHYHLNKEIYNKKAKEKNNRLRNQVNQMQPPKEEPKELPKEEPKNEETIKPVIPSIKDRKKYHVKTYNMDEKKGPIGWVDKGYFPTYDEVVIFLYKDFKFVNQSSLKYHMQGNPKYDWPFLKITKNPEV